MQPKGFIGLLPLFAIIAVLIATVGGGVYYLTHRTTLDSVGSTPKIELVMAVTPQTGKPLPVVTFSTTGKVEGNEYLGLIDKSSGKFVWRMEGLPFDNRLDLNVLTDFDGSTVVLPEGDYFFRLQSKYSKDGDAPLAESKTFHVYAASRAHTFNIQGTFSMQQESYSIDFGDGSAQATLSCLNFSSTEPVCFQFKSVQHTYAKQGSYEAKVLSNFRGLGNNTVDAVQTETIIIPN